MELTVEQAFQMAVTAHKEGKLQDAERLYESILRSQPQHPDANHNLGLIAISANRIGAALPLFKNALNVNPSIEQFWISYIDALVKDNQLKNAKRVVNQAKKKGLNTKRLKALLSQRRSRVDSKVPPQPQLSKLLEIYQRGRFREAEKLAKSLTKDYPDHAFSWKVLGAVLSHTGRTTESLVAMQASARLAPEDAEAQSNLGSVLQHLGRFEEAKASFAAALVLNPSYPEGHFSMGNALREMGRLDEAESSYTKAIALKPDYEDALMNRWQLLFDKGEFEAALKDIEACNSEQSRACSLETLYALGRIDEIYKRIEMQSELDDGNMSVAAFSSFISERQDKSTAHNFCPNPQSFIHIANISTYLEDPNKFITEVIQELEKVERAWVLDGKATATVKGFQTLNHINLFASPSEKMAQLESMILKELDAYYAKFQTESCSFIKKWPSRKDLRGWSVTLKQQGFQSLHIHPGGWLSGVIYLKVVPPLKKDEGAIEFSLNSLNYTHPDSSTRLHQPSPGDIVFFPSSLHHRTIPFTTDTDRIIVAFDLMPHV